MSDLFQVNGVDFVKKLEDKSMNQSSNISLHDIFEAYIEVASDNIDAVEPNLLRSLVFKQFQSYGDYDDQVRKTAQTVSDITETTGDMIHAIEEDNKEHMKAAYNKLKEHKSHMCKMEDKLYIDEQTHAFNRKYLFVKKLDEKFSFKDDGVLFLLQVENVDSLEELYGSIVVKSVTKKLVQTANKALESCGTALIRYENNAFVIMTDRENQGKVHDTLQALHRTFEVKKFKLVGDKTLVFNFMFSEKEFKKYSLFESVYNTLG